VTVNPPVAVVGTVVLAELLLPVAVRVMVTSVPAGGAIEPVLTVPDSETGVPYVACDVPVRVSVGRTALSITWSEYVALKGLLLT
jgi:hypothetical protein